MSVKDVIYLYWGFFLFVIGRTTHLPELNCIIHFSSHVASLLRLSFKVLLSIERVRYAMVSSVNRLNVPRLVLVELRTLSVRKKAVCALFSFYSVLIKCVDKETATYFAKACEKSMMRPSV